MQRDRTLGAGLTATALFRAIESSHPENERLFRDDLARRLAPPPWRILLLPGFREAFLAMVERRGPGGLGNLLCRTRYTDDALQSSLDQGVDQVLDLGVGFDTRAYRIPGIEQTRFFEVDLPAPQRLKRERVESVLGTLPAHVVFVPIDFDRQELKDVLPPEGFRIGAKMFVIWEDVTQYITSEAVDATLRFIAGASGPGSQIAFTYIEQGIIDGSSRSDVDQKLFELARDSGIPWVFGLYPDEVEAYLARRGFSLVEQAGATEYRARYLEPMGREMEIFAGERVVLASVTGSTA